MNRNSTRLGRTTAPAVRHDPMVQLSWLIVLRRYLVWTMVAHLLWEVLQLPLFTIWGDEPLSANVFAVVHCTGGDLLIAGAVLAVSLVFVGVNEWPDQHFVRVAVVATTIGVAYTGYSEWLNTEVRQAWAYTELMPTLPWLGTGLTPLLQWLILPPLGLWIARGLRR